MFDGKANKEVVIKKADIVVEGQASGEWISVGIYAFPQGRQAYVEISNQNADGLLTADAVLFIPLPEK